MLLLFVLHPLSLSSFLSTLRRIGSQRLGCWCGSICSGDNGWATLLAVAQRSNLFLNVASHLSIWQWIQQNISKFNKILILYPIQYLSFCTDGKINGFFTFLYIVGSLICTWILVYFLINSFIDLRIQPKSAFFWE